MNYQSANEKLTGRCHDSRKLCNNTYLRRDYSHRNGENDLAVRLHSTDVVVFHPNGSVTLNTGGYNTVTTKDTINCYSPCRVWSERGQMFVGVNGKSYPFDRTVTVDAKGKIRGALDAEKIKAQFREFDREAARVSRWLSKARGLKVTTHCGKGWECYTRSVFGRRRRDLPLQPGTYECGCVVERLPVRTKLTVEKIMAEPNITVRMAMVHCYGLERFLLDAKAKTLDTVGEYQLLDMPLGEVSGWRSRTIRALKMTCPSTGAVYISPVEPRLGTVSEALDWMYDTEDYLANIGQQT
jgi:hypothetical protein